MFLWGERKQKMTLLKSALVKVLNYLKELPPYLVHYLEEGWLEVSSNRAERNFKPFAMDRKNWLFANVPVEAQTCAENYSLIVKTKETGLDLYKCFHWARQGAPKLFETDCE